MLLVVDASGSSRFGTRGRFKIEQAAQVAATLAFSAIRNNDKVGLLFFTDRVEKYVPPRKGRFHVLRLIRDILYFQPAARGTNAAQALEFLMHVLKRRAIVFLLSDFSGAAFHPGQLRQPLGVCVRKHDTVAVSVSDPAEGELPRLGLVEMEDAESGEIVTVDTGDPRLRQTYGAHQAERWQELIALFRKLGVDHIPVRTNEDFTRVLHRFFRERARRYR